MNKFFWIDENDRFFSDDPQPPREGLTRVYADPEDWDHSGDPVSPDSGPPPPEPVPEVAESEPLGPQAAYSGRFGGLVSRGEPLSELGLSEGSVAWLTEAGHEDVGDVAAHLVLRGSLTDISGIGAGREREIVEALDKFMADEV